MLSVIGGWFITAGVAFITCFLITNLMFFGSFVAMTLAVIIAIFLLVRSNIRYQAKKAVAPQDATFKNMMRSQELPERWTLLREHVCVANRENLEFAISSFQIATDAFFQEEYRPLKRLAVEIEDKRKQLKRQRRREIIGLRRIDPILAVERNTWYFLTTNEIGMMMYCLKRINDPLREHVGNNFSPVSGEYAETFIDFRNQMAALFERAIKMLDSRDMADGELIRQDAAALQASLSKYRKVIIDAIQQYQLNIETIDRKSVV